VGTRTWDRWNDISEVECAAHACLCPVVLSVDMDQNESCLLVVLGMNTICDVMMHITPA